MNLLLPTAYYYDRADDETGRGFVLVGLVFVEVKDIVNHRNGYNIHNAFRLM